MNRLEIEPKIILFQINLAISMRKPPDISYSQGSALKQSTPFCISPNSISVYNYYEQELLRTGCKFNEHGPNKLANQNEMETKTCRNINLQDSVLNQSTHFCISPNRISMFSYYEQVSNSTKKETSDGYIHPWRNTL